MIHNYTMYATSAISHIPETGDTMYRYYTGKVRRRDVIQLHVSLSWGVERSSAVRRSQTSVERICNELTTVTDHEQ